MSLALLAEERGLHLHLFEDRRTRGLAIAERIAKALRAAISLRGNASLALSGGREPQSFLPLLDEQELDWQKVSITLVDERWVAPDSPDSNAALLQRCLPQAFAAASWLPLYRGAGLQQDAEAAGWALADRLPFDVVVLGMGLDGHTASLFPGEPGLQQMLTDDAEQLCFAIPATKERLARLTLSGRALRSAGLQLLAISGEDKQRVLCEAFCMTALERPIAAFLNSPLDIYYSPQG